MGWTGCLPWVNPQKEVQEISQGHVRGIQSIYIFHPDNLTPIINQTRDEWLRDPCTSWREITTIVSLDSHSFSYPSYLVWLLKTNIHIYSGIRHDTQEKHLLRVLMTNTRLVTTTLLFPTALSFPFWTCMLSRFYSFQRSPPCVDCPCALTRTPPENELLNRVIFASPFASSFTYGFQ